MTDYVKEYLKDHPERCSGRTTRLADLYIQKLFTEGEVEIMDHCDHRVAREHLMRRIARRLKIEHEHVNVRINASTGRIELLPEVPLEQS